MYVDVTQSSAELLKLKRNLASGLLKNSRTAEAKVSLLLEDGSAYPLPVNLKFSEVTVDQGTGSVTLRAVFPNPKQILLPGMFVRATLEEGVIEQAVLVSQRGVTRDPAGNAMVMLVGAEEKVEPRIIKVVRTAGDNWLVSEGLKAGDRVILEGIQKARPGTPVKAVPFGTGFLFLDYLKSGKKSFLFLAYAFLGLGIMTKGPFAVLYFLPPVALF